MFDIITIGHATIDFFLELEPKTAPVFWSEKKKDSYICLDFADKTPVKKIAWSPGGNAVNSGIGMSRLDLRTTIVTEVGNDVWGNLILTALEKESIDLDFFQINENEDTDLSVILTLKGERTILSYHYPRKYQLPENLFQTNWIYLTSLGENFPLVHKKLLSYLKNKETNLAYNPGSYELLSGFNENRDIIQHCEVLILNREEAGELLEQKPLEVSNQLLTDLKGLGPQIVVITDGENGSFAYDGHNFYSQTIYPAERVEMTGAGDSFTAGFLSALIQQKDIAEALKWGSINSASVIQHYGATEGLLTLEEMNRRVLGAD